jgi:lipopolysaccharide/colanic/teichoic acid biosynthesis glycosyltransferase
LRRHIVDLAFRTSELALLLSTAGIAVGVAGWPTGQAVLLALSATAVGVLFAAVSPSGSSWRPRRGLSPAALAATAIALVAGWSLAGWGLAPLQSLLAIVVAAVLTALGTIVLGRAPGPRPQTARARIVSRTFDIAAASLLLVLAAPLLLAISLAIFVEGRGPLLYRARRVGFHGREFDMFKFRKMRIDAAGPRLTVADDARLSRIGRMLARTKLDELPQLINVLRGDMALVGPRPEDPSYVALYPAEFAAITSVRPGITGLSQIAYRNEAALLVGDDFETVYRTELLPRKIELDRYYASRRCLALDLRILGWTAVAIVAGVRVRRDELTQSVKFERAGARTPPEALTDGRSEVVPAVSPKST